MSDPEGLEKLAPCPFCGGKADLIHGVQDAWVDCTQCGSTGRRASDDVEAIESWNRRALLASREEPGLREALKSILLCPDMLNPIDAIEDMRDIARKAIKDYDAALASRPVAAAPGEGVREIVARELFWGDSEYTGAEWVKQEGSEREYWLKKSDQLLAALHPEGKP